MAMLALRQPTAKLHAEGQHKLICDLKTPSNELHLLLSALSEVSSSPLLVKMKLRPAPAYTERKLLPRVFFLHENYSEW